MHVRQTLQVVFSEQAAGDTSLAWSGVSPHLEALVREAHRDAWIVVDRDGRMATARMRSIPSHTFAGFGVQFL